MVQVAGFNTSFSAGELGEDAWERTELAQHPQGCAMALNMLGLPTGPNVSRGGTIRVGAPDDESKFCRYVPFERADGEGLVLEFGEFYFRVWTARGAKVMDGASQVEIVHGYSEVDLEGLRFHQVGDIAIITSRDGIRPLAVRRNSDIDWQIAYYLFQQGPWLPENIDDARTLSITDLGAGDFLVTSSVSLFDPGHVGGLFRILPPSGQPGLKSWAPNTAITITEQWISNGRVYVSTGGGPKSGNSPPVHERGTCSDGAVDWQFLHDGAAPVLITSYTDAFNVHASISTDLPLAYGVPTSHWAEGAYSTYRGWPTALPAVAEERLVLGATNHSPSYLDLTRTAGFNADFADFKPGLGTGLVVDDDAVRLSVGSQRARIIWMLASTALIVGTTKGEYVVTGGTVDDPIAPSAATPRPLASYGSADVMPVLVQGPPTRVLHVARGEITLRELTIGADTGTEGRDLSILCQHIFGRRVKEMAWQQPDNHLWLRLDDGGLAVLTYHIEHGVLGARRQELAGGWRVESLCASPDDHGADRVHLGVTRERLGVTQRAHLVVSPRDENVWVDFAVQYEGAPITSLTALDWADGEILHCIVDGAKVDDVTVVGGAVSFPEGASVTVGYPMLRRQVSLPLDLGGAGTMLARQSRITEALVVLGCVTAQVGAEAQDDPGVIPTFDVVDSRRTGDSVPVLRRKRQKVRFGQGVDRDNRLVVQTDEPFDLQVYAYRAIAAVNG